MSFPFLVAATAGAAGADPAAVLVQQLASPAKSPWKVQIPGKAERTIRLQPPLSRAASIRFRFKIDVRRKADRPRRPVRCLIALKNKQGWLYQRRDTPAVPIKGFLPVEIDLRPDSADWDAVGHFRPWDGQAGRAIQEISLRLFSDLPFKGRMLIEEVRVEMLPPPEPFGGRARVLDFQAPAAVRTGQRFEIGLRLDRDVSDPFDPALCDLRARFITPSGNRIEVPAFYFQDFVQRREGPRVRLAPRGLGEWRVRFTPRETGTYKYILTLGGEPVTERWLRVNPPRTERSGRPSYSGAPSRPRPDLSFAVRHGEAYIVRLGRTAAVADPVTGVVPPARLRDLVPLPPLARVPATCPTGSARQPSGRWLYEPCAVPDTAWTVPLQWHPAWGRWEGLGRYNLEIAWQFDRVLEAAEQAGVALPLALLDDRAFFNQGKYRWPLNPLNRRPISRTRWRV